MLKLKPWGVCINFKFLLNSFFEITFLSGLIIYGIAEKFLSSRFNIFFVNLLEQKGLAASCIKTFFSLYFFNFIRALKDDNCLFFPASA